MDGIGGRKFLGALLILLIGGVITYLKGDVPANFNNLLQIVFGTFVAGNVGVTVAGVMAGGKAPDSSIAPSASSEELLPHLEEIKSLTAQVASSNTMTQQALSVILDRMKKGQGL